MASIHIAKNPFTYMRSCASNPNRCNHGTMVECVHITTVLSLVVLDKRVDLPMIMIGHSMTLINQYHYLARHLWP
jgi:hypothetical protein